MPIVSDARAGREQETYPSVIFVGAFRDATGDGAGGGQLAACRAILSSPMAKRVNWTFIDSTMESVPPPPFRRRLHSSLRRLWRFALALPGPADAVLIFTSRGAGFLEKSLMALAAAALGRRVVLSPRSGGLRRDVKRSPVWRAWIRFVLRRCDTILCQGAVWKMFYQELTGLPDHRFTIFPNVLDEEWLQTVGQAEPNRGGHVSLLYLGWLEERKGIFDLLDAFAMYRQQLEEARVIVCGRGSEADAARKRVRQLGLEKAFDFRGWVSGEEKVRVLKESDVLVIPSHAEGLPNVLLEGMAAGLAVVATDVGAIPETLGERAGILVGPRDPESLGAGLVRLCSDPDLRESYGKAARRRVAERHSAARAWPRLLAALVNSQG